MNSPLKTLVTEAVLIDRNLHRLSDRLRTLKQQIIAAAAISRRAHQRTRGGGSSWIAEGFDGCIARVSFPGASLRPQVDPGSTVGARLLEKLGARKDELLLPVLIYEPVEQFRERVRRLFEAAQSRQIIAACELPTPPRIAFETKAAAVGRVCPSAPLLITAENGAPGQTRPAAELQGNL